MERQRSIFDDVPPAHVPQHRGAKSTAAAIVWHVYVDGAARGNPGPAGAGIVITSSSGLQVRRGYFLGTKTNNQAEYLALTIAFFVLTQKIARIDGSHSVIVKSDSELLVRQFHGIYATKNPYLKALGALARHLIAPVPFSIKHIVREDNIDADAMANTGIDKKIALPKAFLDLLSHHQIAL